MVKKKSFENYLVDLENLVGKMESGEMGLEESLDNFEAGVELYKECKKILDKAEKKMTQLNDRLNEEDLEV